MHIDAPSIPRVPWEEVIAEASRNARGEDGEHSGKALTRADSRACLSLQPGGSVSARIGEAESALRGSQGAVVRAGGTGGDRDHSLLSHQEVRARGTHEG